jgi:hypothetical protein
MTSLFKLPGELFKMHVIGTVLLAGDKWGRYSDHLAMSQIGVFFGVLTLPISIFLSKEFMGTVSYMPIFMIILSCGLTFFSRKIVSDVFLMKKSGFVGVNKKTVLWVSHIIYASVSIICILASVEIMDLY